MNFDPEAKRRDVLWSFIDHSKDTNVKTQVEHGAGNFGETALLPSGVPNAQ